MCNDGYMMTRHHLYVFSLSFSNNQIKSSFNSKKSNENSKRDLLIFGDGNKPIYYPATIFSFPLDIFFSTTSISTILYISKH